MTIYIINNKMPKCLISVKCIHLYERGKFAGTTCDNNCSKFRDLQLCWKHSPKNVALQKGLYKRNKVDYQPGGKYYYKTITNEKVAQYDKDAYNNSSEMTVMGDKVLIKFEVPLMKTK